MDIVLAFQNTIGNVKDFEQKNDIILPIDLATILMQQDAQNPNLSSLSSNNVHNGEKKVNSKPLKVFISYSHENKAEKDRLIKFLAVMEEQDELKTWHDGDIVAGDAARQEDILKEVANSDLLLFLVSADSLASENCKKELEEASK